MLGLFYEAQSILEKGMNIINGMTLGVGETFKKQNDF